jgi:hypothetical protein
MLLAVVLATTAACRDGRDGRDSTYLFLWAGDSAHKASDFLAVIDATPTSARYGSIVASIPTGVAGAHPYHTEAEMPADGHLLANGFHAGRTWLFDLEQPLHPRILTSFGDIAGYSYPHTYVRLPNGRVLATFQYAADSAAPAQQGFHSGMGSGSPHTTGGLVEIDERGRLIRSASAHDSAISDTHIFPYSVLPLPAIDRAVSTTTDMDDADSAATAQWVQLWRLSDLRLLKSVALAPWSARRRKSLDRRAEVVARRPQRVHPHVQLRSLPAARRRRRAHDEPRAHVRGKELRRPDPHRTLLASDRTRCPRARRVGHLRSRATARGVDGFLRER